MYFLNEQGPKATGFAPTGMNIVVRSGLPEQAVPAQRATRVDPMVTLRDS